MNEALFVFPFGAFFSFFAAHNVYLLVARPFPTFEDPSRAHPPSAVSWGRGKGGRGERRNPEKGVQRGAVP